MPEYAPIIKRTRPAAARARDFLDIYATTERFGLDLLAATNIHLLSQIFDAKRVPLELLGKVVEYREFHRPDFEAVRATVKPGIALGDFDFYFNYVVTLSKQLLKTLRHM
jgi:hypothetical protein